MAAAMKALQLMCSHPHWMMIGLQFFLLQLMASQPSLAYWLTAELLMAITSTVILGSEPDGTRNHILFSDGPGTLQTTHFLLAYLLRYSLHSLGMDCTGTVSSNSYIVVSRVLYHGNLFIKPLPSSRQFFRHVTIYCQSSQIKVVWWAGNLARIKGTKNAYKISVRRVLQ
jgi:hypothetical protein